MKKSNKFEGKTYKEIYGIEEANIQKEIRRKTAIKNYKDGYINPNKGKTFVKHETRICKCGCGEKFKCTVSSTKKYFDQSHYFSHIKEIGISKDHKKKIVKTRRKKESYGLTEESKKKVSNSLKKTRKNNPDISRRINETKIKNGKNMQTEESRKQISETVKINWHKYHTEKSFTKIRIKRVASIIKNGMKWPAYNKKACKKFKEFDKLNNTNGQYATHPNEFYIKELGYWPDYINFDLKLIIEVDESRHFDKSTGELKEKDIIRQKNIQEFYSDFKFLRFKDTEMDKMPEVQI